MFSENLDSELESIEAYGETEAEWIDQQTELEDFESDEDDEIFGPDAELDDLTHAYASFMTNNETDYNGWSDDEVNYEMDLQESSDVLKSRPDAFHLVDKQDLEEQYLDMEVEDGAIDKILYDEDGATIGFVVTDEDGIQQSYHYISDNDGTHIDAEGTAPAHVRRDSDGAIFSLDMPLDDVLAW